MHYLFQIESNLSPDEAIERLLILGFQNIYEIEEENATFIGAYHTNKVDVDFMPCLLIEEDPSIDWDQEWERHAPGFENGEQKIILPNGKELKLLPGPGFGDLSHSTTSLCLEMIQKYLYASTVIDLGSGSGILSLAACLLGASHAIGIEIDQQALFHAEQNQQLNAIHNVAFYSSLPESLTTDESYLILLNMTIGEQIELFQATPRLNQLKGIWIVSGILEKQEEKMLAIAKERQWRLLEIKKQKGWLLFAFENLPHTIGKTF
ncbi:MAG: 50S ribosomal protein L11 methyltransferase [Simkaniaceae bacterium]|nr:50S ribosomal protein L11 methyltransferase [Simkaniaceae bacterium]